MKETIWKRGCSLLLTLVLVIGLLPVTALAAENTAPTVKQFATVGQLRTEFDMDDETPEECFPIRLGNSIYTWNIAGVDPQGNGLVLVSDNNLYGNPFSSSMDLKD